MRAAFLLFSLLLPTLPVAAAAAEAPAYPRPRLLVEPEQLKAGDARERVVILDARPREEYDKAHVPGARWVDVSQWKREFSDTADADEWSRRIGQLGISADTPIVVYDDNSAKDAARVWWILRFWGAEDARLLNGGWTGWKAVDGPTQQKEPETPQTARFQAQPDAERLATTRSVLEGLASRSVQIIDSRSEGEYCGIEGLSNKRAGSIPGATHLEWSDLIDQETQRFKSANELRRLFDEAGVDLDEQVTTHCQSGGRASVMVFAMELMGADRVQNYYAGWSEWGNTDETPIVKPQPPQD